MAYDLAIEQSLDAAIQVDEVIRKERADAPALADLIVSLIGADQSAPRDKRDLLHDAQFASISHRAASFSGKSYTTASELGPLLDLLLAINRASLDNFQSEDLTFIRDFCLGLNREFVAEAFSRAPSPPLARSHRSEVVLHAD